MDPVGRINEERLHRDDDVTVFNGLPFTGAAYLEYPNSVLKREASYRDGFEEGVVKEWHPNGKLKREWFAIHGRAEGKVTEWHDNGTLKSSGEYESGVELRYEEWSDDGVLVKRRTIDMGSELFKYLQELRQKNHGRS
jgi:antitoxin component YwqK of YwqJK toxin-antitoxin module